MLDELRDMFIERLLLYEKKNNRLPERIFFYRNGVSESQFDQVVSTELQQIKELCSKMATKERNLKKYTPTISIIICGKRHHAKYGQCFPIHLRSPADHHSPGSSLLTLNLPPKTATPFLAP